MDEEKAKYKLKLAAAFISEGKNLHAAQIYRKLIEEDGKEDFYFQLAELYEDMGFVNAGKNILKDLLQIKNNDDNIALFLGQFLLRNSKWFEAIEVLTPISTSNSLTEFLIGYAYLMLNEFELSKEYFTNYVSADDNSCLLYTSDAADERSSVDLGGRRIIKKKKKKKKDRKKNKNKKKEKKNKKNINISTTTKLEYETMTYIKKKKLAIYISVHMKC